jgi:hypothetical protein
LELNNADNNPDYPRRLAKIYERSVGADSLLGANIIQKRCVQKFLYDLLLELFPYNARNKPRDNVTKAICGDLAKFFFSSTAHSEEEVTENLYVSATNGKKYKQIEERLGCGILIVLPLELDKQMNVVSIISYT